MELRAEEGKYSGADPGFSRRGGGGGGGGGGMVDWISKKFRKL